MAQRILIVNDGPIDDSLREPLESRGFEVSVESDSAQFMISSFDLAILDVSTPLRAVELVKTLREERHSGNSLILVLAEWGTGQPTLALANGADAFEPKPIDGARLIAAVEKLLRPRMVKSAKASTKNGESGD